MQENRQKEEQERLARRYAWWQEPDEAMHDLPHLLCQIMAFGTAEDYVMARQMWGEAAIKKALQNARPGAMDDRSAIFTGEGFFCRDRRCKCLRYVYFNSLSVRSDSLISFLSNRRSSIASRV